MTDLLGPAEPRAVAPAAPAGAPAGAPAAPAAPIAPVALSSPNPFSASTVKAAIASALAMDPGIPAGHRGAVTVVYNQGVLQAAAAVRVVDRGALHWDVGAVVSHGAVGGTGFGVLSTITF